MVSTGGVISKWIESIEIVSETFPAKSEPTIEYAYILPSFS